MFGTGHEILLETKAVDRVDLPVFDVLYNLYPVIVRPGHLAVALQVEGMVDVLQAQLLDFLVNPLVIVTLAGVEDELEARNELGGIHVVGNQVEVILVLLQEPVVHRHLHLERDSVPLVLVNKPVQVLPDLDAVGKDVHLLAPSRANGVFEEEIEITVDERFPALELDFELAFAIVDDLLERLELHVDGLGCSRIHAAERAVRVAPVRNVDI